MKPCCPAGRGCNAPGGGPCALELCHGAAAEIPHAALALSRWEQLQRVPEEPGHEAERRFRRRAYERARDKALVAIALQSGPGSRGPGIAPGQSGTVGGTARAA